MEQIMSSTTGMRGFTLIELMITLVLLAILVGIAVPNFTNLVNQNRVQAQADELKGFLLYARSEAVSKNAVLTLKIENEDPWILQYRGETIRQFDHTAGTVLARTAANEVRFRGNGTATAATFTVCEGTDNDKGYFLEIQASGAANLFARGKKDAANPATALGNCTL
jgi:type IV fimbrial biogenesis protein FimU